MNDGIQHETMDTTSMEYNMKCLWKIGLLFLGGLQLVGCSAQHEADAYTLEESQKLIVYTAHKPEIYEPIIHEFEERSGIWVEVVAGGTNQMLEQIKEENGENSGDIMFGGGVDSLQNYLDYFEPYVCTQSANLDSSYASGTHTYTVFSNLSRVLIYNKKLVISAGTPRSWEELLSPRWYGNIAFADPCNSGSSYTALQTLIQAQPGDQSEYEIMKQFSSNLNGDVIDGSQNVVDTVAKGEKLVGITTEENALKNIAIGADIEMVYPREGTSVVPDGTAIIKNAPHEKNAQLFMEFTVSDDVQKLLEQQLYRRSVRTDITKKMPIRVIPYDLHTAGENHDWILEQWTQLIIHEGQTMSEEGEKYD